jgi:hypothetical protein
MLQQSIDQQQQYYDTAKGMAEDINGQVPQGTQANGQL